MKISRSDWQRYIEQLGRINGKASALMAEWINRNPSASWEQIADMAYALATRYGEASASLACDMYDEIAAAQGAKVPPAEPAATATYGETAKAVRGTMKNGQSTVPATTARLVKQAGADTMLQNAARDGAEFAWVPMGDTCAFCLTLASRGWQRQSKKAARKHAEHIHANCDCEYCVRFDRKSTVQGYDPDALLEQYYAAEGDTPQEKINAMRRAHYAENAPTIRAQKRAAYAARREREILNSGGRMRQTGGKNTGGHHYPVDAAASIRDQQAAQAYEQFVRYNDTELVAANTGFSVQEVSQIRRHVFFNKHKLYDGYDRFAPDYDMAVAWKRLKSGKYLPRDITLLRHELLESRLEKEYNLTAGEAHAMASEQYDWQRQLLEEMGEGGEPDGLL